MTATALQTLGESYQRNDGDNVTAYFPNRQTFRRLFFENA